MSGQAPPPIGDYALVSDSQGAALVSRSGSIDWACVPRFDSPSTFARLLGERAGAWALAPTEAADVERSYVDGTMVLRTVFRPASGAVAVTDAMPFLSTSGATASARGPRTPSCAGWRRAARRRRPLRRPGGLLRRRHRLVPRRPGRPGRRPLGGARPRHLGDARRAPPLPVLQAHVLGGARPGLRPGRLAAGRPATTGCGPRSPPVASGSPTSGAWSTATGGGDGLDGSEASFGACTYRLAHALALAGDVDGARRRFDTVTSFANDVGLLSEEVDGATGELLGNFPQAFTHIGLVNATHAIAEAEGGARPR